MELGTVLKVIAISVAHWMLVTLALDNLTKRQQVLGAHKAPWAISIIILTCVGSIFYLMLHPQPEAERQTENEYRRRHRLSR